MTGGLVEAWKVNCRVNLYVLDALMPEALKSVPVGMKGRRVGEIFAHIHNVRLMWLEQTPDLMPEVSKIPLKTSADKDALTIDSLRAALVSSAEAISSLLKISVEKGKVGGFKRAPETFLSYLIAHEGYHHGEICMTLTQAGHRLDEKVLYGMWEWDKL